MENTQIYLDKAITIAKTYGPKLVILIVALLVGLWIIKGISKLLGKALKIALQLHEE